MSFISASLQNTAAPSDRLLNCGHDGCRKQVLDSQLEIHIRKHFLYYPFQCYVCRGEFAEEEDLRVRHFPRKHPKDRVRVLINEDFELENKVVDAMTAVRIQNTLIKTEMTSDLSFDCWSMSSCRESTPGPILSEGQYQVMKPKIRQGLFANFESFSSVGRDEKPLAGLLPKREVDWSLIEGSLPESRFPEPQLNSTSSAESDAPKSTISKGKRWSLSSKRPRCQFEDRGGLRYLKHADIQTPGSAEVPIRSLVPELAAQSLAVVSEELPQSEESMKKIRARDEELQLQDMLTPPLKRTKPNSRADLFLSDSQKIHTDDFYENLVCDLSEFSETELENIISEKRAIERVCEPGNSDICKAPEKDPISCTKQNAVSGDDVVRNMNGAFHLLGSKAAAETISSDENGNDERNCFPEISQPNKLPSEELSSGTAGKDVSTGLLTADIPSPSAFEQVPFAAADEERSMVPIELSARPNSHITKKAISSKTVPTLVQTYGIKISKGKSCPLERSSAFLEERESSCPLSAVKPALDSAPTEEESSYRERCPIDAEHDVLSQEIPQSPKIDHPASERTSSPSETATETPKYSKKIERKSLLQDLRNLPYPRDRSKKQKTEKNIMETPSKSKSRKSNESLAALRKFNNNEKENEPERIPADEQYSTINLCKLEPISPEKLPRNYPDCSVLPSCNIVQEFIKKEPLTDHSNESKEQEDSLAAVEDASSDKIISEQPSLDTNDSMTGSGECSDTPISIDSSRPSKPSTAASKVEEMVPRTMTETIPNDRFIELEVIQGPPENEICYICQKQVEEDQDGLVCDLCEGWVHRECCKITPGTFRRINRLIASMDENYEFPWKCPACHEKSENKSSEISASFWAIPRSLNPETNALHTVHLEEKKARKDERMRHLGLLRQSTEKS